MLMMHFGRHGESKRHGIEEVPSLLVQRRTKLSLSGRIKRALRATGYSALRTIEVVVQGRCVVLQGVVPSYHMKQMAQVVTLAVPGVQQLCNDVEVIPPAALAQTGLDGCSFVVNQKREAS
jgi:osmotically-inducible protein OsmY